MVLEIEGWEDGEGRLVMRFLGGGGGNWTSVSCLAT
jgi:hypothetical protein